MAQGHEDSVFAGTKCVDPDSRPSPDPLSIQRVDEHDIDLAPFEGEQGLLVVEAPQDEPIYLRGAAPVRRVGDELGVAFWHMGHQPEWARADGGGEGELGGVHLVVLGDIAEDVYRPARRSRRDIPSPGRQDRSTAAADAPPRRSLLAVLAGHRKGHAAANSPHCSRTLTDCPPPPPTSTQPTGLTVRTPTTFHSDFPLLDSGRLGQRPRPGLHLRTSPASLGQNP